MSQELRTQHPKDLKSYLQQNIGIINDVATATLTPERMVRLVCAAASKDEQLAKCSPLSILRSLSQAASMGLEPFDGRNEVHLVPRWNKKSRQVEATCLVGYPGLIRLATDTGKVNYIDAQVAYAKDDFDYGLGDDPFVKHRPYLGKDRGERIAVYAVAKLVTGERKIEIIPYHEIEAIRDRSVDSEKFSPWKTDESEMARETGIRRISKYLPKSKALAAALELQARNEAGKHFEDSFPEGFRPGDPELPTEPLKVLNGDGQSIYDWTDADREEVKAFIYTQADALTERGVSDEDAQAFIDSYLPSIGDPELSPEKLMDRALNNAMTRKVPA